MAGFNRWMAQKKTTEDIVPTGEVDKQIVVEAKQTKEENRPSVGEATLEKEIELKPSEAVETVEENLRRAIKGKLSKL